MARTEVRGGQVKDASVDLAVDVTGTLPATNGGTGAATLLLNALLLGNGTGAIQALAAAAAGYVVRSNGTTWTATPPVRVNTLTASSNTYTPNVDTTDLAIIAVPAANFTVAAPTGTPTDGQRLMIRIRCTTARTPTWNAAFISSGIAPLPTAALPANKTVTAGFIYDSNSSKYVLMSYDGIGY